MMESGFSTGKAEAGGSEFKANLHYRMRPVTRKSVIWSWSCGSVLNTSQHVGGPDIAKKKNLLGVVAPAFSPSTQRQRQADLCEVEAKGCIIFP